MNNTLRILLITLALIVVLFVGSVAFVAGIYNGLVRTSQAVDASWAQVQNVYQRRADLIPNLVQTVAGSANFEKSTMIAVTEARASVGKVNINPTQAPTDPAQLAAFQQAQGQLGSAISRLLVVSENYPDLKSSTNFRDLQAQLEGTENRIAVERERFNVAVQIYNIKVRSFPVVILAGMMGYAPKPYFTAAAGASTAPTVQFNFGSEKK
ncbi:MAG: LemA family protein [Chthoniobacterales bacterium]|nr:LemA family protein [Chthoniobacterales bacterium]